MTEAALHDQATADQYRRQAEHLRRAIGIIQDQGLRRQLSSFAEQYDAAASGIERELEANC